MTHAELLAAIDDDVAAAHLILSERDDGGILIDKPMVGSALDAVAPSIAARARKALLGEAVAFVREYEDQWGNEPYWHEVAGHLARADALDPQEAE